MGVLADFRVANARFGARVFTKPWSLRFQPHNDCCIYVVKGEDVFFEFPGYLPEPVKCPNNTIIITTKGDSHSFRDSLSTPFGEAVDEHAIELSSEVPLVMPAQPGTTVITQVRVPQRVFINFLRVSPFVIVPSTALETVSRVHDVFRSINDEILFNGDGGPTTQRLIERLTEIVVILLTQYWLNHGGEVNKRSIRAVRPDDPYLKRVLDAVHDRPHNDWTLDTMSQEAGLRRSTFCMRFKQVMRVSPMQYLTSLRMSIAASRMRDADKGLAEIAWRVGYRSEAAFNRAFRREFNMTPGRYRRMFCGAN